MTDASAARCRARRSSLLVSIAHAKPLSVGINCALGAGAMRPYVKTLAEIAAGVHCYPNAGLYPLSETGYDETPETTAAETGSWRGRDSSISPGLLRHCARAYPGDRGTPGAYRPENPVLRRPRASAAWSRA